VNPTEGGQGFRSKPDSESSGKPDRFSTRVGIGVRDRLESVFGMDWNQCPGSIGAEGAEVTLVARHGVVPLEGDERASGESLDEKDQGSPATEVRVRVVMSADRQELRDWARDRVGEPPPVSLDTRLG